MYAQFPSVSSALPGTANVTIVPVTRPPPPDRPSTTPLLQLVYSKALYKAAEIAASHAGPRSTVDMRLYRAGNQKALILHAARLSQAMQNAASRARAKISLPAKPPTIHPKSIPTKPNYLHPDSNPIDALLGKTIYFSHSGQDGRIIAKNGNGSIVLPLYDSGSVTVTKRTIGLGRRGAKGGGKSAVVLKDAQGNVTKRIRKNPTLCFD